jgi:hypothetical protein
VYEMFENRRQNVFFATCSANPEFRLQFCRPHAQWLDLHCKFSNCSFSPGARSANPGFTLPFQDPYMRIVDLQCQNAELQCFIQVCSVFTEPTRTTPARKTSPNTAFMG